MEETLQKLLATVRTQAKNYDESKIYFTLRKMKVRNITEGQITAIKYFLALRELGLPVVTTTLYSFISDTDPVSTLALLHRLSAKRVLNLIREKAAVHTPYRFMLSDLFLRHFQPQQNI